MREVITFKYESDRREVLKNLRENKNPIVYPAGWLEFGAFDDVKYRPVGEKSIECIYSSAFLDIEQALGVDDYDVVREAVKQ